MTDSLVEPLHFLHQHSVHALLVQNGVLLERRFDVVIGGKLVEDVERDLVQGVVRLPSSSFRLNKMQTVSMSTTPG